MGWWTRMRAWTRRAFEKTFVDNPAAWLVQMFGGRASATGAIVTPATAMQSVPIFAAVRDIAEDVAKLPLKVYRWREDGGKEPAPEHPLYPLLHDEPNPEQTSIEFREMLVGHALIRANAYAEIVRQDGGLGGRVTALWPIHPDYVRVERRPSGLLYWVYVPDQLARRTGQREIPLSAEQVLHLRGFSLDGILGLSPVAMARESVGLTLAVEEYGARFFGNGAQPGGAVKFPQGVTLGDQAFKKFSERWAATHEGLSMAHRVAILEGGADWVQTGLQNDHAQFIQTRLFQLREMARLFRMQPHKLGDLERATFSNIEHQGIEYVTDTLLSWLVRMEQKLGAKLLTPAEKRTHFIRHVVSGLLRGDITSRYSAYAVGRQWGWLSADDIRELEDMNPLPDRQGTLYLTPLNMAPAGQPAEAMPGPEAMPGSPVRGLLTSFVGDVATRAVRREVESVRKAALREAGNGSAWRTWVDEFYGRHTAYLAEVLHVSPDAVRRYTDEHRALLLAHGVGAAEAWDGQAATELMTLVDAAWASRRS